ncbi:tyrosine-type recombinase/integrase [Aquirhabdus parva]|uniref:Site-specific integrase n=1 Tax=Aquirhabdus parva TaxID=2283318 RepID=A0A345P700_9GAMM|nr:site-specific integrase [Aquirhabdus parva]AXI03059.1 site-specific integrase [Aquirhabdus parva]
MLLFDDVVLFYDQESIHKSKQRDISSLKRLKPFFQNTDILELSRSDIRAYMKLRLSQGVCNSTINRELRYMRAAINFYKLEFKLDFINPASSLSLEEPDSRVRFITPIEAQDLIRSASKYAKRPHLPCFISLALNTGCRKNELFKLEWSRVDFHHNIITLGSQHTKTAKRRYVPINENTRLVLENLQYWNKVNAPHSRYVLTGLDGESHIKCMKNSFRRACDRADIFDFRIHDLRHTFASWLVQSGVSLYVVKDLLGHSSITQTEKYAHLANPQLHDAVKKLPNL